MKKLLLCLFLISTLTTVSQELKIPKVIPPSPTVANLMQFE